MVTEACHQFAVVQPANRIQSGGAAQSSVIFRFLCDHVQHDPQPVHVIEDDVPLIQLAAVEALAFIDVRPHPRVTPIPAIQVVGQEINTVHALACQVIEGANDALALVLPGGVTGSPVLHVGLVFMEKPADMAVAA